MSDLPTAINNPTVRLPGLGGINPTAENDLTPENLDIQEVLLTNIAEDLRSTNQDVRAKALESLSNIDEIISVVEQSAIASNQNPAELVLNTLLVPLSELLENEPSLIETYRNIVSKVFKMLLARGVNGTEVGTLMLPLFIKLEEIQENIQENIFNHIATESINFALDRNNLTEVLRILSIVDSVSSRIFIVVYQQILDRVDDEAFSPIEKNVFYDFLGRLVICLPLFIKSDEQLTLLLTEMNSRGFFKLITFDLSTANFERIVGSLSMDDGSTLAKAWNKVILMLDSTGSPVLEDIISKIGVNSFLNILGISMDVNNPSQDLVTAISNIELVLNKYSEYLDEDTVGKLSAFVIRAALKERTISDNLVQIQLRALTVIEVLNSKYEGLIPVEQFNDFKKILIVEIELGLKGSKEENNRIAPLVALILPPKRSSLFSSEERLQVYSMLATETINQDTARLLHPYFRFLISQEGNENLRYTELFDGSYEFKNNIDLKKEAVEELKRVFSTLSLEVKKSYLDRVLEGKNRLNEGSRTREVIIFLILQDDAALEYYNTKLLEQAEIEGSPSLMSEFEELRTLILDNLDQEKVLERIKDGKEGSFKRWHPLTGFKLRLVGSGPRAERERLRLAREAVEKDVSKDLESGVSKLYGLVNSSEKVRALLTDLNKSPEVYTILVETLQELYEYFNTLDATSSLAQQIEKIFVLVLDNNAIAKALPPQIQVIRIEMWKSSLDAVTEGTDNYTAVRTNVLTTRNGETVNLESLRKREQRRYERKLTKKFAEISTPRGECLSQIVAMYNSPDKSMYTLYSGMPQFQALLEYAIDQYNNKPEDFFTLSESEVEFLNYLVFNSEVWSRLDSRIKYKISMLLYKVWSQQDPMGQDILIRLTQLRAGATNEFDFELQDQINTIAAAYRYAPDAVKTPMIQFVRGYYDESGKLKRKRDRLLAGAKLKYAEDLNELLAYILSSNKVTSKAFFASMDEVASTRANWEEQDNSNTASLQLSRTMGNLSESINPRGQMLTTGNMETLNNQISDNLDSIVQYIAIFNKLTPPLPYRTAVELSEAFPTIIDVLMHSLYVYKPELKEQIEKLISFITKLVQLEPSAYYRSETALLKILEDLESRIKVYRKQNDPIEAIQDDELKDKLLGLVKLSEEQPTLALEKGVERSMSDLSLSIELEPEDGENREVVRVFEKRKILPILKDLANYYINNFNAVSRLDRDRYSDLLEGTLQTLLVYLHVYSNNPSVSRYILRILEQMTKVIPEDRRTEVYIDFKKHTPSLFGSRKSSQSRVLPSKLSTQVETYFNVKAA